MEKIDNMGEIFWEGNMINLKKISIQEADKINEQILNEEKKIKNELYEIAKGF